MNQAIQVLTNNLQQRLRANNPQAFNQFTEWVNKNNNPAELFSQITSNYTPQQMQNIKGIAKSFGIPDNIINQVIK
jgi:hypothetical protein